MQSVSVWHLRVHRLVAWVHPPSPIGEETDSHVRLEAQSVVWPQPDPAGRFGGPQRNSATTATAKSIGSAST